MRRRIAVAAVLAVGLALGTTGCTFLTPVATLIKYNPGNGVSLDLGIQYTSHTGGSAQSKTVHVALAAGQVISFGNPGVKQVVFRGADVPAGALLKIFLQYGSVSGKNLLIPVLNNSEQPYQNLGPSPLPTHTPTPTPTATLTPTPTPTK